MPARASVSGRASALNCGLVRERGIERTSTSRSTATCLSKATNSAIVRVEWPIVKIVVIGPPIAQRTRERGAGRSWRRRGPKMTSSFKKVDHLVRRMDRQRMMGEARPWRNIGCHFAHKVELSLRCLGEQSDHQILQCDHANTKLYQLGIRQLRDL